MQKLLLFLLVISFSAIYSESYSQVFDKQIIVDTPGDNYSYDVYRQNTGAAEVTVLMWINKDDSLFTIRFNTLSPEMGNGTSIESGKDSVWNINTAVYDIWLHAAWQRKAGNFSQIVYWYMGQATLDARVQQDGLGMDATMDLENYFLSWADHGTLYCQNVIYPNSNVTTIDYEGCSSPDILQTYDSTYSQIIYSKDSLNLSLIKYAHIQNDIFQSVIESEVIDSGKVCLPRYSTDPSEGKGISYQYFEDGVWKVKYSGYLNYDTQKTSNISCNYYTPVVFSYDVPAKAMNGKIRNTLPFFVVYESDSLEGNSEIMLHPFYFGSDYPDINISNQPGRDYNPKICMYTQNDTPFVCVFWQNELNGRNTIYMAKTVFDPIYSSVNGDDAVIPHEASLNNYPNPFNPSTTIEYKTVKQGIVNIKVYDIPGREVSELVNEVQSPGAYKVNFNAAGLASGTYIILMRAGDKQLARKIMIMK
jgi:hypothetical protein